MKDGELLQIIFVPLHCGVICSLCIDSEFYDLLKEILDVHCL